MRSSHRLLLISTAFMAFGALGVAAPAIAEEATAIRYAAIPRDAYSIVVEVCALPGKEDALRAATLPLVALVRSDPKNLVYFLQEDREIPGRFVFYEVFASREDFEAHNAMPYVQAWLAKLPDLTEGGVKITRMRVVSNRAE